MVETIGDKDGGLQQKKERNRRIFFFEGPVTSKVMRPAHTLQLHTFVGFYSITIAQGPTILDSFTFEWEKVDLNRMG